MQYLWFFVWRENSNQHITLVVICGILIVARERERALRVYLRLDFMIVSLCHFCNFSIFLVKHYSRCTHGHRHKFEPRNSQGILSYCSFYFSLSILHKSNIIGYTYNTQALNFSAKLTHITCTQWWRLQSRSF